MGKLRDKDWEEEYSKGTEEVQDLIYNKDGALTMWIMGKHLGEIVELNEEKKR